MRLKKRILSAAMAMCMSVGAASLFPAAAEAKATDWDNTEEWGYDWMPYNFISGLNFHNLIGSTKTEDNIICISREVPDGCRMVTDIKSDSDGYSSHRYVLGPDYEDEKKSGCHYEALLIVNDSAEKIDVEVKIKNTESDEDTEEPVVYTFENRDGVMEETDIYSWLPDSACECKEYVKLWDSVTYRDGILAYFEKLDSAADKPSKIKQTGGGKLETVSDVILQMSLADDLDNAPVYAVKTFKGTAEGDVDISFGSLTEKVHVDKDMKITNRKRTVPEWAPRTFEDAADFMDEHGTTCIADGFICIAREVYSSDLSAYTCKYEGSAAEGIEDCKIFDKYLSNPNGYGMGFNISIYDIPDDSDITMKLIDNTFPEQPRSKTVSFVRDSEGNVSETDMYAWVPDCKNEVEDIIYKKEEFSIQHGYVMYCDDLYSYSSRFSPELSGTGSFIEEYSDDFYDAARGTSTLHCVRLFKPIKPGVVKIDMYKDYFSGAFWEHVKTSCKSAYFRIDDDMNITAVEEKDMYSDVKGDCNGDGMLSVADAVSLKKWLQGSTDSGVSVYGKTDLNGDGTVDVFDYIALKKLLLSSLSEAPEPVFLMISENYTRETWYEAVVYDQYGTEYVMRYQEQKPGKEKYIKDGIVPSMDSDDWYKQIELLMENAKQSEAEIIDYDGSEPFKTFSHRSNRLSPLFVSEMNRLSKGTETYSKEEMKTIKTHEGYGETTIYFISEDAEGKPVYAELAKSGDITGCIDNEDIKYYIRLLNDALLFSTDALYVFEQ